MPQRRTLSLSLSLALSLPPNRTVTRPCASAPLRRARACCGSTSTSPTSTSPRAPRRSTARPTLTRRRSGAATWPESAHRRGITTSARRRRVRIRVVVVVVVILTLTLTPTLTLTLTPTPTLTLTLTLTKAPAAAARQAPRPPCVQFVRPGSIPLFGGASAWGPGLAPACFCGLRARLQGRKVPPGRWRAPAPGSRQPPKLPLSRCLETLARGSRPPLQAPSHRSRHSRFAQGRPHTASGARGRPHTAPGARGRPHTASGARGRPLVQGGAPSPLGGARVTYP